MATTVETTTDIALRRLQLTTSHLSPSSRALSPQLSLIHGPTTPALRNITFGALLDEQCVIRGASPFLIVPFSDVHWSFNDLRAQARILAYGLLEMGVEKGDRIGILAGNCEEYVTVFFAAAYVGAVLVVLNSTYTAAEAIYALMHSGIKILFVEQNYGRHTNADLLSRLATSPENVPTLETVVTIRGRYHDLLQYKDLMTRKTSNSDGSLLARIATLDPSDVCNFQYTSGSTGSPKAAMLTHHSLLNNARGIGSRLSLSVDDTLCCPPPLFHCFGLVLGLLACLNYGATIVIPSPIFSAPAVLDTLHRYDCTALHGVPAMFEEILSLARPVGWSCNRLRTGIVAGAPVPVPLMKRMFAELGMREFTSSYGLTEASPTVFNAECADMIATKLETVGRLLPHLSAKVIDPTTGAIVPIGQRGELCVAGYSLQKGYWKNAKKTDEAMKVDEHGIRWLHTGDEAVIRPDERCTITGRFKDIIIRGGENIYPVEIEARLVGYPGQKVARASVIGVHSEKYGEVVGAFLLGAGDAGQGERPSDEELRAWVRADLSWHKAPVHIWWFGDARVGLDEVPQTGSGKVKKHVLREVAARLVRNEESRR